jgi:phage terminase large subunit-like protein
MGLLDNIRNVAADLPSQDLEVLLDWAKEKQRLIHADPLNHSFPPHQGQTKVHDSAAKEVFLVAANRWGKSVCGIREVLWRARGSHPHKNVRMHDVIWCGFVDYGFYNKVTKRLFEQWCPKEHLIHFHESEKWAKIRRIDGGVCTIFFLSYEMGRESWQGGAVDMIWLDEELPEDIYSEASARLIDKRGDMLLTQTPVSGLGWAYDRIYLPSISGVRDSVVIQGALATKDPNREYGVGESLVPHLDRQQIVRFAQIIKDPDERDIRIFGEFKGRSGGVYKMFDPSIHVIPPFAMSPNYEIWGAVDPGYHGFSALIFAMDPMGRIYVAAEYFSQQENHTQRARELWDIVQKACPFMPDDDWFVFYCDTANPQDIMELNHWSQEVGARMVFASLDQGLKAREAGIQRVQEYLTPVRGRTVPPSVVRHVENDLGEPMLYFFDTLHSTWQNDEDGYATSRIVWELQRYLWKKRRRKGGNPDDADENSAGGAHALASLRYGIMARLSAPTDDDDEDDYDSRRSRVIKHVKVLEERLSAGA